MTNEKDKRGRARQKKGLRYYIYRFPRYLKIAYFLRVPLFGCLFLILFPAIAYFTIPHMLIGLFDLSRGADPSYPWAPWRALSLFLLTLSLLFLSWSILITGKTVLLYGGTRFDLGYGISTWTRGQRANRLLFNLSLVLPLPIVLLAVYITFEGFKNSGGLWIGMIAILAALPAFLAITALVEMLHRGLVTDENDIAVIRGYIFPFRRSWLERWEKDELVPVFSRLANSIEKRFIALPFGYLGGYVRGRYDTRRIHPEHRVNVVFFALFVLVYLLVGTVLPAVFLLFFNFDNAFTPSIVNLVLVVTVITWVLSGLMFFFDGLRIPGLVSVLLLIVVLGGFFSMIDLIGGGALSNLRPVHFYYGRKIDPKRLNTKKTPDEMLRFDRDGGPPPFVILVAAEGGGIQAAAWTARVLTGLESECRELFKASRNKYDGECSRRIRLISGASGGSVGGMFVAAAFTKDGLPSDDPSLRRIYENAAKSSLDAVSWGLAYPDNLRLLGVPNPSSWSRGVKLEEQWWRNAPVSEANGEVRYPLKDEYLSDWGDQRWRPSVIFNATVVETGERALITDTKFSFDSEGAESSEGRQPTFARITKDCGNIDLKVVTAARLSASFPFVTPTARGLFEGVSCSCEAEALHFADGGYHDNFGTASLRDWLEDALNGGRNFDPAGPRILIIQIMANSYDPDRNGRSARSDFFLQWYSPIVTLYNNRVAGQKATSVETIKDIKRYWNGRGAESNGPSDAPPSSGGVLEPITVRTFKFTSEKKDEEPPLSWHLTAAQKADIDNQWTKVNPEVKKFREFICQAAKLEVCNNP